MRSRFWSFVEACDDTSSPRAVRDLLAATLRDISVSSFAIVTHAPRADLRSLGVEVHTWPQAAMEHLFGEPTEASLNPLFDAVERTQGPVFWPNPQPRKETGRRQARAWFARLHDLVGGGEGVSQALRSTIVSASCSVVSSHRLEPDRVKLCMRMGDYAYRQVLALQRPRLSEPERLTAREHEFLYHAAILGERPRDVASRLGVKVSTVRTLRQKATIRLDAGSQEEAAWRLIESGQLFRGGRKGRPRSR